MPRILFYASYPTLPIGYSKVAYKLACGLAQTSQVTYFGVGRQEDGCRDRDLPANIRLLDISAQSRDAFGMDILATTLDEIKPDIFLIYNDIIVTCRAFNALLEYHRKNPQTRFISYIDLVYPYEKLALLRHIQRNTDAVWVFSECWRRHLIDVGFQDSRITVVPHGFSTDVFYPVPAAKAYFGFAPTDFVVLNCNRNTYRKAQDITIRAFIEFLNLQQWDPRIYLFLHCELVTQSGYSILDMLEVEAARYDVDLAELQRRIRRFPGHVEDVEINLLYNAADVGINTCMGEGFGLCNMEHAALGKPQVVSRVGALVDIFAEKGTLIEPRAWIRAPNSFDEHSGDLGICSPTDFAQALSTYFTDTQKREEVGMWGSTVLPARYNWSDIIRLSQSAIQDVLRQSGAEGH